MRRLLKGIFENGTVIFVTTFICVLNLLMLASYAVYGADATADAILAFLQPSVGSAPAAPSAGTLPPETPSAQAQ